MAEIRIEQKRRSLGWLWLLLALLVVAALAWYFLYPGRTPAPATPPPPTSGALDRSIRPALVVVASTWRTGWRQQLGGSYGAQG